MERNFTNENFEEFLRQNADGLRMRPSAKVWKQISDRLNQRRRRVGFILGISLLITSGLGYYLLNNSSTSSGKMAASLPSKINTAGNKKGNIISPNHHSIANTSEFSIASVPLGRPNDQTTVSTFTANASDIVSNSPLPFEVNIENAVANNFTGTVVDSYEENRTVQETTSPVNEEATATDPLTIESVLNYYQLKHKSKLGLQLYFTPTISYRKLSDNNIENVTSHKPDFGFEMGLSGKYPVSKNIKLRGGIQFNVNRYAIKTNSSFTQTATIRVNDRYGVGYVNTPTNFNNFSGRPNWLENFYFQVSAPVGIELKIKGDENVQFGVASTIQPTYLLGDRAYLISTDYKNYAEVPKLVRHWNVNTSLETYVAYSTGHVKWQVGPQVRYQLLSSYLKKYPVKENLFDFGLKVGVSLNNR